MSTLTITYDFILPLVGGDADVWGGMLNDNFVDLDLRLTNTFDTPGASNFGTLKTSRLPANLGSNKTVTDMLEITSNTPKSVLLFENSTHARYLGIDGSALKLSSFIDLAGPFMVITNSLAEFSGVITGDGSGLTDVPVNANNITSGVIPNARISGSYTNFVGITASGTVNGDKFRSGQGSDTSVASYNDPNTGVRFPLGAEGVFYLTSDGEDILRINGSSVHVLSPNTFSGSGADLTNLPAESLTGTINVARLPDNSSSGDYVRQQYAKANVGEVGTFAFLRQNSGSDSGPGDQKAGSTLTYANAGGAQIGGNPSGTWECMGRTVTTGTSEERTTMWFRVS